MTFLVFRYFSWFSSYLCFSKRLCSLMDHAVFQTFMVTFLAVFVKNPKTFVTACNFPHKVFVFLFTGKSITMFCNFQDFQAESSAVLFEADIRKRLIWHPGCCAIMVMCSISVAWERIQLMHQSIPSTNIPPG